MARISHLLLPTAALLLAAGCTETGIKIRTDPVNPLDDQPEVCIKVNPERLTFDAVDIADPEFEPQSLTVTVSNDCVGDLEIKNFQLNKDNVPFELGKLEAFFLPGGETTTFTVSFNPPTSGKFNAKVLLDSNATLGEAAEVRLEGEGIAPRIKVTPETYDYGSPFIGCESAQPFEITNEGNADLIVDSIELLSASVNEFGIDIDEFTNGNLPFTIGPFDSANDGPKVEIFLDYLPLDTFRDDAHVLLYSNDPFRPEYALTADGTGTKYGDNLDIFEQPIRSATDILFTLDRSCSMYDNNANVVDNFDVFVNTLSSLDADYHAAVFVGDVGCTAGPDPYIDSSFSEAAALDAFTTMADITPTLIPYGANEERGYMIAEAALSTKNIGMGGCNNDYYRSDAFLSLVHVSDEPEQSVSSWSYYVALFQSLKADPEDVKINAVAGDFPSGCSGAAAGAGYYEGTVATGGLFLSICSTSWAEHLEELATESVSINNSFELSQQPVPQTIEIRIDGIRVNTGWEYDISSNSVVFDNDFIPAGGSLIEVEYAKLPDCEG